MADSNKAEPSCRTPVAIALAVIFGLGAGQFLTMTAVPFGPVFLGLIVVFLGAVIVTAALCVLATRNYIFVGFGYSAGVAIVPTTAAILRDGFDIISSIHQFTLAFTTVAIASLLGSSLAALLKWEDKRARELNRRSAKP